jgi:hypothetical protein
VSGGDQRWFGRSAGEKRHVARDKNDNNNNNIKTTLIITIIICLNFSDHFSL